MDKAIKNCCWFLQLERQPAFIYGSQLVHYKNK